jgi:prohead serine protease
MSVKTIRLPLDFKDAPDGHAIAGIVHFDAVDLDGDVVLKSAWPTGETLPIQPSHDWTSYAIGEGKTGVKGDWGTVELDFFTETTAGRDWYLSAKRRGDRQQWSFGYQVLEAEPGVKDGVPVQFLKKLKLLEASPVMLGAQPASHTMAIKAEAAPPDLTATITTTGPSAVILPGNIHFVPSPDGMPFADQLDAALAAVRDVAGRSQSLADLRSKEGRTLSGANRTRLAGLADTMRSLISELDELLAATEPTRTDAEKALPELARLVDEFRAIQAYYGLLPAEEK